MKTILNTILNTIKTLLLTGIITIMASIPVMADSNDSNILNHYTNCDVNIVSNNYIDNSIIIEKKDGQQYKFYVDNAENYYMNEIINVTFNDKMEIVDCTILDKPQIYNTQISQIEGDRATLNIIGDKYTFVNEEGVDGWRVNEKCKAIIQNGRLLEVRPIPLCER